MRTRLAKDPTIQRCGGAAGDVAWSAARGTQAEVASRQPNAPALRQGAHAPACLWTWRTACDVRCVMHAASASRSEASPPAPLVCPFQARSSRHRLPSPHRAAAATSAERLVEASPCTVHRPAGWCTQQRSRLLASAQLSAATRSCRSELATRGLHADPHGRRRRAAR
jgi:hypothetical protein